MSVGEVCNREVIVTGTDTGARELAELMRQHHVGCIVVTEGNGQRRPVGMVTDRDLVLEVMAPGLEYDAVTAGDLMTRELLSAHEQDGIWETVQRMRMHGIRRMPVLDKHGGLVGIITFDDLLELLTGELADLARLVGREISHEKEVRERP